MAAIDMKHPGAWKCLFKAPTMPAFVFSAASLLFSGIGGLMGLQGLVQGLQGATSLLVGFLIGYVVLYLSGLVSTALLGIVIRNILPDRLPEVKLISWLNGSRWGRILLLAVAFVALAQLGIGALLLLLILMCLFEFLSNYDHVVGRKTKAPSNSAFY